MHFSIEEIKKARDEGYQIDSLIKLFESKEVAFSNGEHWYTFIDNITVCEFCGLPYRFGDSSKCEQGEPF